MKTTIFTTWHQPAALDTVILLIRIAVGVVFIMTGQSKIQNPTGWMGPDSNYAGIFQALAAISEFCGGIAIILGLVTRLAAFGIACTMAVAMYEHIFTMGDPYVNTTGGSDFKIVVAYLLIALLLLVNGPGRFSLDRLIFGVKQKEQVSISGRF